MSCFIKKQQGVTLAIALMMLFVVTLVGISSVRTTHIQEKMAHNIQDKVVSFQAAETALIGAENLISSIPTEPIPTAIGGCPNISVNDISMCIVDYNHNFLPEQQSASWWTSNGTIYNINYPSGTGSKHQVQSSPIFYVEFLKFVPDNLVIGKAPPSGIHYYRVFSFGTGATNNSRTVLESTYNRRY
jgi:type IV pilus assembly protein PilX